MVNPYRYASPDQRLARIQYARDLEEERSARLDEMDAERDRDTQRQFQVELQRKVALDQRDDIGRQMQVEEQRAADLDERGVPPSAIQEQMRFERARSAELDRRDRERPPTPPVSEWMPQRDEAAALGRFTERPAYQAGMQQFREVEQRQQPPAPTPRRVYPGGELGPELTPGFAEWEAFAGGAEFTPTGGTRGFQEFYGRYRANLDTRLQTLDRRNQQRAVEGLPPLTEEEEDLAARRHAWDELQAKGAVQRGWGAAFEALDYPRQMVKEKVIEPVVPEFAQEIPGEVLGEVLEAALPTEVREAAGVVRAVGGPSIPDVTITSGQVEEIASWILDPWNLLPVVGWGPDLVRAANAARRGVPTALRGLLKNPQVRTFLDDAIRAGERGGPKVPGVGPEDVARVTPGMPPPKRPPVPGDLPPLPEWGAVATRIRQQFPEAQKLWKGTSLTRRVQMKERTARYFKVLDEQLTKGVELEDAKHIASREYKGEMADLQFAEAFATTPEELASLNLRGLEYARETGRVHEFEDAYTAIAMMAEKRVPRPHEIKYIRLIYGDELADSIQVMIKDKDWWETAMDLWMIPKAVRSAFDISFPARQGIMVAPRHPILWSKSVATSARAMADPDWMARETARILGDSTPVPVTMPDGSSQISKMGDVFKDMGVVLERVEPFYRGQLAEKLPLLGIGVKRSNIAFAGAGNRLRTDMTRHWLNTWIKSGVDITPERLEKLGALMNALTGRATVPKGWLFEILQATWWSPQYRLAGPQVLGTILKHGVGAAPLRPGFRPLVESADPLIAGIAAQNLVAFVGGGIGILSMLKASGLADVELDSRSTDFGKIKLGPTRINFWGTSQLLVRTIAQAITGTRIDPELGPQAIFRGDPLLRYWQSGASPEFQIVIDLGTGQTYLGEQMYPSKERGIGVTDIVRRELDPTMRGGGERILPLAWLDIKEAVEEDAVRGGVIGSAGMIGLGVQSYRPKAAQELQNIPEFRHMTVPQIQELKDFWVEVKDFRDKAEKDEGIVVPPELAIRALGDVQGRALAFIELAVDLRAGTTTRKGARNPDYLRFIVENEDEIREDAPWLITQEVRLLIHELEETRAVRP